MKLRRKYRILTALIALVGMLFMQLAVASYVCPGGTAGPMAVESAQAPMQSMPDCDGPDPANPALCQAHCQDAKSSLDKPQTPSVTPAPVMVSVILTPLIPLLPATLPSTEPDWLLQRITAPPMSIRHCCFRI